MANTMQAHIKEVLKKIKDDGLFKQERIITSPQNAHITVSTGQEVLNMCANNYLGLSGHPDIVAAAREGLDRWGNGLSSVRFICGTQQIHRELEQKISDFLGTDDTILYSSCFDANGGLFETLLTEEDAVISDELNHASVIDGIRLCKARRFRYRNNDMADLEAALKKTRDARFRMIATDGVFSMDGIVADLNRICELAEKYDALVMIDDSHATGVIGRTGRGTPEYCNCRESVDIITGTLGKALGGASGGFTSGRQEIIDLLRQRSRPYLFSNTLAPAVVTAAAKALDMVSTSGELVERLHKNTGHFRDKIAQTGFEVVPGDHPIVPIMLGDSVLAQKMAAQLLEKGVYVVGFFYPVVPKGKARIRVQVSAAHTTQDLDFAVDMFNAVSPSSK